jgi:ABC-type multidrug transport system ATPase subunit
MDEPFTHFDQHVTLAVVEKLRKYSEGAKIIFSTHTKEQADLLGARPFLLGENS